MYDYIPLRIMLQIFYGENFDECNIYNITCVCIQSFDEESFVKLPKDLSLRVQPTLNSLMVGLLCDHGCHNIHPVAIFLFVYGYNYA